MVFILMVFKHTINMAASMEQSFVKYFALFLFLNTVTVRAQCPQQDKGSESTNQKAQTLAGLGYV